MKVFKIIIFTFILIHNISVAQTWHTQYNGLYINHFEQLQNNEIILAGSSFGFISPDSSNIILIKTDSSGNIIWSNGYGSPGNEYANYVTTCKDSGYIIAGYTTAYNSRSSDVILIKTDKHGIVEWSRAYGGDSTDEASVVLQTPDNGFIVGGKTHSLAVSPGSLDMFLMKTDSSGNMQWIHTYGDAGSNNLNSLAFANDSTYFILGNTGNYSGYGFVNFYLAKIDLSGNLLWEKSIGTSSEDHPVSGHTTTDGGYIACGLTWIVDAEMYVVKINSTGNIDWAKQFGSASDNNIAYDIYPLNDSCYILTGKTDLLSRTVATIIKLDQNGDTLWTNTDSEYLWDYGINIRPSSEGFLIQTKSSLFTTDSIGNSNCNGFSQSYYYNSPNTQNYTFFHNPSPPLWISNRIISVDTLNGVSFTPGCSSSTQVNYIKENLSASIGSNPVSDNHFRIILPGKHEESCILNLMDNSGRIVDQTVIVPEKSGENSVIDYFSERVVESGLYYIQIFLSQHSYNLKVVVFR